jgi:integrase
MRDIVAIKGGAVAEIDPPLTAEQKAELRDFLQGARANNTRRAYARAWRSFVAWCDQKGRQPMPAAPETIALWILAACRGELGPPMGRASINQALAAIALAHHHSGHPFDRKHRLIAEAWRSASRAKAKTETLRQAQPITSAGLRAMLEDLGRSAGKLPADARDAALLALGWAGALRRSELVGLDYEAPCTGTGILRVDARGPEVILRTSKGSQTEAVKIAVPCDFMPAACAALKTWVETANLQPGEPVFRPIDKGQRIGPGRLTDGSVARIIKARVRAYHVAIGKSEAEAEAIAAQMSGHSMRAGYATAAAFADVPSYRIQQHTRHKSAEMVSRYVREADRWKKNGLKGVGF